MLIKLRGTLEIEKRFLTKKNSEKWRFIAATFGAQKTQMEKIYIKYLGIAVWAELQSCRAALM